jgi:phosphatidylinositol-3-phosphatase
VKRRGVKIALFHHLKYRLTACRTRMTEVQGLGVQAVCFLKMIKFDRLRFASLLILLVLCISCHLGSPKVRDASKAETSTAQPATTWQPDLPVYDHVVIIVEENKNYRQIIGSPNAPYLNDVLRKEGANLTRMFAEEHFSEGNYFWLFSGSNQHVGFLDRVPDASVDAENLGHELISSGRSFSGYSEGLPAIGSTTPSLGHYARKHVPWISFSNIPQGTSFPSSNLRFEDFPTDFTKLPTVAFVIPNLVHDMHDGSPAVSVSSGDEWLRKHIDPYYQWAKQHNGLLIITFDEDARARYPGGLTAPASTTPRGQNRIPTLLAGAHIRNGDYEEGKGVNHVSLLRTLEAMYHLKRAGKQQELAQASGIKDDFVIMDVFDRAAK